jgi:hypothetical protein
MKTMMMVLLTMMTLSANAGQEKWPVPSQLVQGYYKPSHATKFCIEGDVDLNDDGTAISVTALYPTGLIKQVDIKDNLDPRCHETDRVEQSTDLRSTTLIETITRFCGNKESSETRQVLRIEPNHLNLQILNEGKSAFVCDLILFSK